MTTMVGSLLSVPSMARILTAVAPDTEDRVRRILTGHELVFVRSLTDAESMLQAGGIQLVFVGAAFDESRMFELLDYIRRSAEHENIPIVAAIVGATRMTAETISGLAHATKIFGASIFVNLNDFPDEQAENARIRIIVEALLLPADVVPMVVAKVAQRM
jgi:hypothetical protein